MQPASGQMRIGTLEAHKYSFSITGRGSAGKSIFLNRLFRPVNPHVDPRAVVGRELHGESAAVDVPKELLLKSAYEAVHDGFTHT